MRKLLQICVLTMFVGAAFAQTKAKPAGDDAAAVRAADRGWLKVFQARDVDKSMSYIGDGGAMFAPNGPAATTPDAIKKVILGLFAMPGMKLTWTPTDVVASKSGDYGVSSGTYDLTFTDNGKPAHDKGKYVTVWKKQADGSWKVYRDIFNTDMPMPGAK